MGKSDNKSERRNAKGPVDGSNGNANMAPSAPAPVIWTCNLCTLQNVESDTNCRACSHPRDGPSLQEMHRQREIKMQSETIYKQSIWSKVTVDYTNLKGTSSSSNPEDDCKSETDGLSSWDHTMRIDVDTPIATTQIDDAFIMDAEDTANQLVKSIVYQHEVERAAMEEWLEQYRKRQELMNNLKDTMAKTAEISSKATKFAWKKGVKFTKGATSMLKSAGNAAWTKIEEARSVEGAKPNIEASAPSEDQIEGKASKSESASYFKKGGGLFF